ncbi:MAG TPA: VOC family protein [Thermoplasmata archaeon]|nr:VOC family protein [Thermoplasmata archaeon]
MASAPRVFRILLGARDLPTSLRFYESLLGVPGRLVADGRYYFDCGEVIVGLLDRSRSSDPADAAPLEAVYFATNELEAMHARAGALGALGHGFLHGDPSNPIGEIAVRPWGERSFYVEDPSGNPLCFVDESTRFTGTEAQVAALRRARGR